MSLASKLTLAGTSLFAVSTILFVHYAQNAEKAAMHQGVIRDLEQQRLRKERQEEFDMQHALELEYKKLQPVNHGDNPEISEKPN